MSASATDAARLLVSIEATQRKFEKQMAATAQVAAGTAKGIEDRFKKANDNVAGSFDKAGKSAERSLGAQRAAAANLSFQLNDIATSLLGGASPFQVMAQQGGQVTQIITGSGGLTGSVKLLGAAFGALLNPVGLASIALIGLTGYAVQYFSEWLSSGSASAEEIQKHADLIQRVADRLGDTVPELKEYAEAMKLAADSREKLEAIKLTKEGIGGELKKQFEELTQAQVAAVSLVPDANREYTLLAAKMEKGSQSAADFQRVIDALNATLRVQKSPALEAAVAALEKMRDASGDTQTKLVALEKQENALSLEGVKLQTVAAALASNFLGLQGAGTNAIEKIATSIGTGLVPNIKTAVEKIAELIKNFDTLQDQVNKNPLGQLSPIYSGGGRFLNEDQNNTFQANEAEFQEVGKSAAAALIRGFESFSGRAYADTRTSTGKFDAYRAGFGSDTVTRQNSQIERVTKDTVVTLDDAERDLSRRILEFQSGIQNAIGVDTWRSLNEGQKAALTSIAYNYGSLPKQIVEAIQSGGGPEIVAKAIAGLSANPDRRKKEAQSYLSGTGYSMADAGLGSTKKSPEDVFKGDMQQIQARIDVLTAEYDAQSKLNPAINDYGFALEKARVQQQLLADAQKAGVEVTPELKTKIEDLATSYAKASAAGDQLKDAQGRALESARASAELGKSVFGGFISDLQAGKSGVEALQGALSKLADKLLDSGLNLLFDGGVAGSGGGLLGKIFSGFTGGFKLAGGGRVNGPGGPTGDKIPAMLSDGEHVTRAAMVRKHGPLLDAINADRLPGALRLAKGGMAVRSPNAASLRSGSMLSSVYSPSYQIDARGSQMSEREFRSILEDRDRKNMAKVRGNVSSWVEDDRLRRV